MTTNEILAAVKAGKLTLEEATRQIDSQRVPGTGNPVRLLKKGRIRVQAGAQIDLTGAQALAVLDNADAIRKLLKQHSAAPVRSEEQKGRKDGETFTAFYAGDMLIGYAQAQVDRVKAAA